MTEPVTHREFSLLADLFKAGIDRLSGQIEASRTEMHSALNRGVARMDRMEQDARAAAFENTERLNKQDSELATLKADMVQVQAFQGGLKWALRATWAVCGSGVVAGLGWLITVAWKAAIAGAG